MVPDSAPYLGHGRCVLEFLILYFIWVMVDVIQHHIWVMMDVFQGI